MKISVHLLRSLCMSYLTVFKILLSEYFVKLEYFLGKMTCTSFLFEIKDKNTFIHNTTKAINIPSIQKIDLIFWHLQWIVVTVKYQIMAQIMGYYFHISIFYWVEIHFKLIWKFRIKI